VPAAEGFRQRPTLLRNEDGGLATRIWSRPDRARQSFYVSDESEENIYTARVDATGRLTDMQIFAQRAGESIAADVHGNEYIAAG
jgi:hypothetical protein